MSTLQTLDIVPTVRGPRTLLRAFRPADRDAFVCAARASQELHAEWVSVPSEEAAYDAYLARRSASFLGLGLFREDGQTLVGVFNLSQICYGLFCSAYLGYYAFTQHERRGLMGEGLELALHLAFRRLGLHRVEANIQPGNTDSILLVARHGFVREGYSPAYLRIAGEWRDHERWAIRQEIWKPRFEPEFQQEP
jgi:ribosomal-protein-alanine N-acetyltransferase